MQGGWRGDLAPNDPSFPSSDTPEVSGLIVIDGQNRKWPGKTPYPWTKLGIPTPSTALETRGQAPRVRFLAWVRFGAGEQHLLASDGRDLWRLERYTDGSATFTENGKTVTGGDSPNWQANGIEPGMFIRCDSVGVWREIASVDSETQLTLVLGYPEAENAASYTIERWECLTPLYTTGLVTSISGTDVTGTTSGDNATAWADTNCRAGMMFKLDADDTADWTEINALDDETQIITLAESYKGEGASGAYTIRQRFSFAAAQWLRATMARHYPDSGVEDVVIVTNGVDPPLKWDGVGQFGELGGSPPMGRFITTFHNENLLVMARYKGQGGDPDEEFGVRHSNAQDFEDWSGGNAAEYRKAESTAPITGLDGSHEYLFLFREDGIHRGFYEGTGVGISWSRVSGVEGPVYPNTLVRLGGGARMADEAPNTKWCYFGRGNIYTFDGDTIVPIGDPIKRHIFESDGDCPINPNAIEAPVGTVVPRWGLAIWSFPTGTATECTHTVAYDYRNHRWFLREGGWSAAGEYRLDCEDDERWDELTGQLSAQTRVFDKSSDEPQPVMLCGDTGGNVYWLGFGVNDNGEAIHGRRKTATFPLDEYANAHEIGAVSFRTTATAGAQFTVSLYGSDNSTDPPKLDTQAVTLDANGEAMAYFRSTARYVAVEIFNGEANDEYGLIDLTVWARNLEQ